MSTWRKICKAFEIRAVARAHPGWREVLETCAVFDFTHPNDDKDPVPQELAGGSACTPLPFPKVAFCSSWSTTVLDELWYTDPAKDAGHIGAHMLSYMEFREKGLSHLSVVVSGYVEASLDGKTDIKWQHTTEDLRSLLLRNNKPAHSGMPPFTNPASKDVITGAFERVTRCLLYLSAPSKFIVKQTPVRMNRPLPGKIPRLYQRPTYIILDKSSITTRYTESQPTNSRSPMPHLRRGHYRTLMADRYKEPGKRVWVRATHVKGNDVEWREGDRHYKVI